MTHAISKTHVVSILLTLLFLSFASPLFLSFKPGVLSFKYQAAKDAKITVCYARKGSESFNRKFCPVVNIAKGDGTSGVPVNMRRISKVHFGFEGTSNSPDDVKLSDFKFANGIFEQKIPPSSIIEHNDYGNHRVVEIFNVKLYSLIPKIDCKILIILTTIFFLFSCKMVKYLAVFKIEQHHSRIDIVFLACFFGMLFVPMSDISTGESDLKENRTLQKYAPLFANGKINNDFGKNFEAYFNDRFFGRHYFIKYYENLRAVLSPSEGNVNVLVGKNDFLFFRGDKLIKSFQNAELYPDDFLRNIAAYLQGINDFCKKRGKLFYYFIAPDKNRIYGENIKYVRKVRPDSESRTFQLVDYLKKHTDVKVIYPYDEMLRAKTADPDDLLYWKYDTHWSERGAYAGYLALMKEISKDTGVQGITVKDWQKYAKKDGDLAKMLGGRKRTDAVYLKPKFHEKGVVCDRKALERNVPTFCDNPKGEKRIVLFHDSFMNGLRPFIAASFKESYFYWRYPNENIDTDIMKNSDIIVLENAERFTRKIISEYQAEDIK